ncbi:MAG: nucleotidyltransferase domain-containing protein, partial [Pseudooceanicola sp.]|nr:nucleotidyltransferase domain-containing protein [Pseudooceanicola sp.]
MTRPRRRSLAPASEPAVTAPDLSLICEPGSIFDVTAVTAALDALPDGKDGTTLRNETVRILREANTAGRAAIAEAFARAPFNAQALTRSYAWLTDCLVISALRVARTRLHPLANPTASERLALIAVGGYGRGEMAPFSDVDLLFVTPYKITPWAESVIESMLYILWDLRMKVGHASRTIRECIKLGQSDFTIRTALLEHRFLTGDERLAAELDKRLKAELFAYDARAFLEAKLEERQSRHEKFGQRYMVEPNVKEG